MSTQNLSVTFGIDNNRFEVFSVKSSCLPCSYEDLRMSHMTLALTGKQQDIVDHVSRLGRVESIYQLSKLVGRPYRRVYDHVRHLRDVGLVKLVETRKGGRRQTSVELATQKVRPRHPELSYNRIWSCPVEKVDEETFIASVLTDPSFEDLMACVFHYGQDEVIRVYRLMLEDGELKPLIAAECGRILANIEIGIARATGKNAAPVRPH